MALPIGLQEIKGNRFPKTAHAAHQMRHPEINQGQHRNSDFLPDRSAGTLTQHINLIKVSRRSYRPSHDLRQVPDHRYLYQMNISFPHDKPGIYSVNETVVFPAIVNGRPISCEISVAALKEHFDATVPDGASKSEYDTAMVAAFESGRERIEAAAARRLASNLDAACVLMPENF